MKRREHQDMAGAKGKTAAMMMGMENDECGVDELLAALGYKVRASDMADVAQKLQQLEVAMACTATAASDDSALLPQIASDTVHYDPSDLSTWLDSMLAELNAPPFSLPPPPPAAAAHSNYRQNFGLPSASAVAESSAVTTVAPLRPSRAYDLKPIPCPTSASGGRVVYGADLQSDMIVSPRDPKRLRTSSSSSSSSPGGAAGGLTGLTMEAASSAKSAAAALPVVVVDTQETGIRLVHALLACAEAVQQENFKAADALVKQISMLAPAQGGPMRKVAGYFAEALARRIYRRRGPLSAADRTALDSPALNDLLHAHFYESCPYLKFAHFTANQAILEAFDGCRRVHVIDLGLRQGMQWPALLQALALRPGGPPSFRLTGIGPPQSDRSDALRQVGWKLATLAKNIGIQFHFRSFEARSLADLEPQMLCEPESGEGEESEAVAVNSVMELHQLLARPASVEKVLATVQAVRPRIVTVVEEEANHNGRTFLERFTEALHYYSSMFDSLESGGGETAEGEAAPGGEQQQHRAMTEAYLGRQICNVVACEGMERTERHETLGQWRGRMAKAGFEPVHLGSNAFKQASMLLALYAGGEGFRVEEADGCLTLGWHTRPLIATSAWCVTAAAAR